MKAVKALLPGCDLLRSRPLNVDAIAGKPPDATSCIVIDPDAAPVPLDLISVGFQSEHGIDWSRLRGRCDCYIAIGMIALCETSNKTAQFL